MPWYRVTKVVKGRSYAYLQRSIRDGGRVRTENRYLGPVGSVSDDIALSALSGEPQTQTVPVTPTQPPSTGKRLVVITKPKGLHLRFDPHRHHIDPERLKREYARVRDWAEGLGVAQGDFPTVVIRKGTQAKTRRAWFSLDRVVSVPKTVGRKAVRAEFSQALGLAFLDSVKRDNPIAHQVLANHLEPTFRTTNRLLLLALAGGGEQSRLALSLQIAVFGRIHPVAGVKAGAVGLVGYGKRGSWEDETAQIIGEIATKGYRKSVTDRVKAVGEALAKERKARLAFEKATAFDRFTGKRRMLKRQLLSTTAARMATEEAHHKLHTISRLIPELTR